MKLFLTKMSEEYIKFFKKDITFTWLENIDTAGELRPGDMIFYHSSESLPTKAEGVVYKAIDKLFTETQNAILSEYIKNYDRYYLRRAIKRTGNRGVDTIAIGSSYSLFGIDEVAAPNIVNCGLASQDLYYATKIAKSIIENNENIKHIVLCCAYYALFSNLSLTTNESERLRNTMVYAPILGDTHHCLLGHMPELNVYSAIFDVNKIISAVEDNLPVGGYFVNGFLRQNFAYKNWEDKNKHWQELSVEEKAKAGLERANMHNDNIKYTGTLEENFYLLKEFSEYCAGKNKALIIAVPPASKYYRQKMLGAYKDIFEGVIGTLQNTYILNLYENDNFLDEDYVDSDHLNDNGARKFTQILLENMPICQ